MATQVKADKRSEKDGGIGRAVLTMAHMVVRHAVSKDCSRAAMRNVAVTENGTAVATDGHILLTVAPSAESDLAKSKLDETQNVDGKALHAICKASKDRRVTVEEHDQGFGGKVEALTDTGIQTLQTDSENMFPNWQQIMPKDKPAMVLGFDAAKMLTICKAAIEYHKATDGGKTLAVLKMELRDPNGAVVLTRENVDHPGFKALLMPCRLEEQA